MADIELVIKIPEEEYNLIKTQVAFGITNPLKMRIANGTPLPKGHGRLIDADELKKAIQENDVLNMTGFNVRLCDINNTPTVIEAGKAESEGKE